MVACFLPFQGQAVTVLRLLRLLRVLRLVHALPRLQVLVNALLKSVPSMGYVSLFLGLLFYVYAVAGVFLFGHNDPVHFQSLERAFLSLFQIVTLEGWVDVLYTNMYGCDTYGYDAGSLLPCTAPAARPVVSILYFVSFILLGTMIILNLFIGVIMKSMEEAQEETDRSALARISKPGAEPGRRARRPAGPARPPGAAPTKARRARASRLKGRFKGTRSASRAGSPAKNGADRPLRGY